MADQQVGLDAVWNNADFNKGQAEYIKKLATAANVSQETAQKATEAGLKWDQSMNRWRKGGRFASAGEVQTALGDAKTTGDQGAQGMDAFGAAMTGAGKSAMGFGLAVGASMEIARRAISFVISAAMSVKDFGWEALNTASRVQQLNYIAQILGQKAGYTSDAINGIVESIRAQGVAAGTANNLVAQFLQANLDLSKASELARVAQDSATLAGTGSSEAIDKLIYGIQTQQIEVLRSAGITISAEQAYKDYAATLGVTATSLTQTQKKQVLLDAVIAEGARVAGAYDASMQTASKQLGSLTSRVIPDFLNAMGAPFQTAFFNAIMGLNKFISSLTVAFSEGGRLYPILVNLGAAAAIVAEGFSSMAILVGQALEGVSTAVDGGLENAVVNAYNWGVGLATQFAQGIINGASSALTTAINWVSGMLSKWFQPHSPPLVAKNIDTWGGQTMTQYLEGFSLADYSVLDGLQGPIKNAIDALVSSGDLGKDAGGELFKNLSEQLIAGISSGSLDGGLLATITQSLGVYGEEIAQLAQQQMALAASEQAVTDAEKALADARDRVSSSGAEINAQTIEYNKLLRSGATKEELDAQKAKIDAARAANEQAKQDEKTAEAGLDTAKDQQDALKTQVQLQEKLIQQLLELAKAQEKLKDAELKVPETGGAGGAGGVALPDMPDDGAGGLGGITDAMKDAIENAKQNILESVNDMWNRVQVYFWIGVSKAKQTLIWLVGEAGAAWNGIADYFGLPSWQQIQRAWSTATTWIVAQVRDMVVALKGFWDEHGRSVQTVVSTLWGVVVTAYQIGVLGILASVKIGLDTLSGFWTRNQEAITNAAGIWWNNLKTIWANNLEILGNVFDLFAKLFKGDWEGAWKEFEDILKLRSENARLTMESWWVGVSTYFGVAWSEFALKWSGFWTGVKNTAGGIMLAIQNDIRTKWNASIKSISDTYAQFIKDWDGFWGGVKTSLDTAVTNIVTGVNDMFFGENGLQAKMTKGFTDILNNIGSDFSAFYDFGVDLMKSIIDGFLSQGSALMDAIQRVISDALGAIGLGGGGGGATTTDTGDTGGGTNYDLRANTSQPMRAALPSVSNSRTVNIQVNAMVASGGMTLPQLESAIRKTAIRGLTGV